VDHSSHFPPLTAEQRLLAIFRDVNDPSPEWRRQLAEFAIHPEVLHPGDD
jgi:hypothetical protein